MLSNRVILCHPLLLLLSIFPSIRIFSNESPLCIRWPKYWKFSFSISPSNEYKGWFPLGLSGLISLQSKELSRVFWKPGLCPKAILVFLGCSFLVSAQESHRVLPNFWTLNLMDYWELLFTWLSNPWNPTCTKLSLVVVISISCDIIVVNNMTLRLQLSEFESWPHTSYETLGKLFNSFVIKRSNVWVTCKHRPQRRLSTEELMLSNYGAGEDSWKARRGQGNQTSQS